MSDNENPVQVLVPFSPFIIIHVQIIIFITIFTIYYNTNSATKRLPGACLACLFQLCIWLCNDVFKKNDLDFINGKYMYIDHAKNHIILS